MKSRWATSTVDTKDSDTLPVTTSADSAVATTNGTHNTNTTKAATATDDSNATATKPVQSQVAAAEKPSAPVEHVEPVPVKIRLKSRWATSDIEKEDNGTDNQKQAGAPSKNSTKHKHSRKSSVDAAHVDNLSDYKSRDVDSRGSTTSATSVGTETTIGTTFSEYESHNLNDSNDDEEEDRHEHHSRGHGKKPKKRQLSEAGQAFKDRLIFDPDNMEKHSHDKDTISKLNNVPYKESHHNSNKPHGVGEKKSDTQHIHNTNATTNTSQHHKVSDEASKWEKERESRRLQKTNNIEGLEWNKSQNSVEREGHGRRHFAGGDRLDKHEKSDHRHDRFERYERHEKYERADKFERHERNEQFGRHENRHHDTRYSTKHHSNNNGHSSYNNTHGSSHDLNKSWKKDVPSNPYTPSSSSSSSSKPVPIKSRWATDDKDSSNDQRPAEKQQKPTTANAATNKAPAAPVKTFEQLMREAEEEEDGGDWADEI